MKRGLKNSLLITVVFLVFAIAVVLGNWLLNKVTPSSDLIVLIACMALFIFLSFKLGYDSGYGDGKNNKM